MICHSFEIFNFEFEQLYSNAYISDKESRTDISYVTISFLCCYVDSILTSVLRTLDAALFAPI